jgi:hypothetical protein
VIFFMVTKESLIKSISQLRQKRYSAERRCETIGKMLAACLIFRPRVKGTRDFQPMKTISSDKEYKNYAYLTCYYKRKNWYRYVRKQEQDEIEKLTDKYRVFSQSIAEVRSLNKSIVEVLEKVGQIQEEGLEKHVTEQKNIIKRNSNKKRTK